MIVKPLAFLLQHRFLIRQSVGADLRYRTAGTSFGLLWLAFGPVLMVTVYSIVYLVIFRVRPTGMTEYQYVLYIFCGLVPFLGMSEGIVSGLTSLSTNADLLRSTVFPAEVLPVRAVLASQSGFAVGLVLLAVAAVFVGQPSAWWLLLPLLVALQIAWLLGLAWILSVAHLVFRDLQSVVAYVMTMLMVLSPIAYTPEMLPSVLRPLLWLNPLAYFVLAYQKLLIAGAPPSWFHLSGILAVSLSTFGLGYIFFGRARAAVSDYV